MGANKKNKNKAAKPEATGSKPIKHSAGTFNLFDKLRLDAPITTAEVPGLLEKLEAQLADYKEKVSTWEEKRDDLKRQILEGCVVETNGEAVEEPVAAAAVEA